MRKLIELAVRRKMATGAIASMVVVLGALSLLGLPVDFLPNLTYPMIKIHVWWINATPEEIEEDVAEVIEREIATVEGLDYLESSSIEGSYTLQVNFRYGVDVDVAFQDVQAAMARAARRLPPDIEPPIILKADPQQLPIVQLSIESQGWDLTELRDWTENWLVDRILGVPGVGGAEVIGGSQREIRVHLDPSTLEKHALSVADIRRAITDANIETSGGRLEEGSRELIVRTTGELSSLEELGAVVVQRRGLAKVTLRDVAEVIDHHEEVRIATRFDSTPCVLLNVQKQSDANSVEVARALNERLDELRPITPDHVRLATVEDRAAYVEGALASVRLSAMQAAGLVLLVTVLFLGSLRQAVVLMIAMPLTLVASFIVMRLGDFTINTFSLAGIVVALGVLLDNSIVVIEAVTRAFENRDDDDERDEVAIGAATQVAGAVTAGTLTLTALFVPYLLVSGLTSLLFRELIVVVASAVVISLICSLTVVPMLGALFMGKARARPPARWQRRLTDGYGVLVSHCVKLRWLVLILFIGVLVGAVYAVEEVGSEFIPKVDDGRVMIKAKLPTGASLAETDRLLARVEAELAEDPLIKSAFTLAGGKVWGLYTFEVANQGQIDIQLVPRGARQITTGDYVRQLGKRLKTLEQPGAKLMARQPRIKGIRKMGASDIEVQLRGPKLSKLASLAGRVAKISRENPLLRNVYLGVDLSKPELLVSVDRTRAEELGVSVADVSTTIRSLLQGELAGHYQEGAEQYSIRLRVPEERLRSRRDIEEFFISSRDGQPHRLRDVATITEGTGPVEIVREDQVRQVAVRADAAGASVGKALSSIRADLADLDIPAGYEVDYGGAALALEDLSSTALNIMALALFLASVVLAVQFNTLRYPFLILLCLPMSLAGMVFALWWSGFSLGATVLIGLIVVAAATVNDGVLLFTLADNVKSSAQDVTAAVAVREAARVRLRPRVMTTATTLAGLVPLALNVGEGGDLLQPMAVAAIGGLLAEIPVALFLMPGLYVMAARPERSGSGARRRSDAGDDIASTVD